MSASMDSSIRARGGGVGTGPGAGLQAAEGRLGGLEWPCDWERLLDIPEKPRWRFGQGSLPNTHSRWAKQSQLCCQQACLSRISPSVTHLKRLLFRVAYASAVHTQVHASAPVVLASDSCGPLLLTLVDHCCCPGAAGCQCQGVPSRSSVQGWHDSDTEQP